MISSSKHMGAHNITYVYVGVQKSSYLQPHLNKLTSREKVSEKLKQYTV